MVDFPQALTGLDYLKDLETRRRREVAAAMNRLAIDRSTLDADVQALSEKYPGVLQWVKSIEDKERKVEALYTQVYVALRRWVSRTSLLSYQRTANKALDSDQRALTSAIQQAQLCSYAQHSISTCRSHTANLEAYAKGFEAAARRLLQIHPRRGEEWPTYTLDTDATRQSHRR